MYFLWGETKPWVETWRLEGDTITVSTQNRCRMYADCRFVDKNVECRSVNRIYHSFSTFVRPSARASILHLPSNYAFFRCGIRKRIILSWKAGAKPKSRLFFAVQLILQHSAGTLPQCCKIVMELCQLYGRILATLMAFRCSNDWILCKLFPPNNYCGVWRPNGLLLNE